MPGNERLPQFVRSYWEHSPETASDHSSDEETTRMRIHSQIMKNRSSEESARNADEKHELVQKYLGEQNAKFDYLINKNLNSVLLQQAMYEEDVPWQQLLLELAITREREEVSKKMSLLTNKVTSWFHWSSTESQTQTVAPGSVYSTPPSLPEHSRDVSSDEAVIESFIDSLDHKTKISLLRQLKADLELSGHDDLMRISEEISKAQKNPSQLLIDKIESLMIILVRLSFIGMKFIIPLITLAYHKFKNNDVFVFNNKNFNRLLSFLIRFMETLESKLANDKFNAYRYGSDRHKEEAPELELPTPEVFDNTSWSKTIIKLGLEHLFGIGSKDQPTDYTADPKYSLYFSQRKLLVDGEPDFDTEDSGEQQGSFLQAAQQFADQMS